jgi:uncharacterized damage-inducible protein DinB
MKKEVEATIHRIENTLSGQPWYGKPIFAILQEVNADKAKVQLGGSSHSLLDILYHMNTWAHFTLKRIQKDNSYDLKQAEALDWRTIDNKLHSWKKGLTEYKKTHKLILAELARKDDDFLLEMVDYRKYNFRFLINGLIEHNIYHAGQIALMNNLPDV